MAKSASCSVLVVRPGRFESGADNGKVLRGGAGPLGGGVKLRDVAKLLVALLEQIIERQRAKLAEVVMELLADDGHGGGGVVLGAAFGLGDDIVDAAQELGRRLRCT